MANLRRWTWIVATVKGTALAWLLGMLPSTVIAMRSAGGGGGAIAAPEPGLLVQYALAATLGVIVGPILAIAQWSVLRRSVPRASRWLAANAVAWIVGMPILFAGMGRVPWGGHPVQAILAIYIVCGLTGLIVGAIHGQIIVRLVHEVNAFVDEAMDEDEDVDEDEGEGEEVDLGEDEPEDPNSGAL